MISTFDHNIEQGLPASIEAERTILGAVLLENKTYLQAAEALLDSDFHSEAHRRIFTRMADLFERSEAIDIVTLSEELRRHKELEASGGAAYLSGLIDGVPHQPSIANYTKIVKDKSIARDLIHTSNNAIAKALEQSGDVRTLAARFQQRIAEIVSESTRKTAQLVGEFTGDVWNELGTIRLSSSRMVGLETGVHGLDDALGGLRPGENIVVAARTGGGKSAFAMQVARISAKAGIPVGVFSLEMRKEELLLRCLASESAINHLKLRNPHDLSDLNMELIAETLQRIKGWPMWIDDSGQLTIHDLIARGRTMVDKGCKLLVVDYLQLVRAHGSDTRDKINQVSNGIRELAKATKVPIITVSQLARPERDSVKAPTIYELKESGNIEQDAHVVLLLHRAKQDDKFTHEDEVIVGKQRSGPTGSHRAVFYGQTMQWKDRA